ncbi:hypothetical protein EVA_06818, partial [gut metagenome]
MVFFSQLHLPFTREEIRQRRAELSRKGFRTRSEGLKEAE